LPPPPAAGGSGGDLRPGRSSVNAGIEELPLWRETSRSNRSNRARNLVFSARSSLELLRLRTDEREQIRTR